MPATEEATAELGKLLDEIVVTDPESLSRSDLGPLSLEEATPLFELAISLFRDIRSLDLRVMPQQVVQQSTHWARELVKSIESAKGFDVEGSDPMSRRRGLIQELDMRYGSAISTLGPHVSYVATRSGDAQAKMRELEDYAAVKRDEAQRIVREAEVALESVKGIAGEAGVEQHSRIFKQQAIENGATARRWLKAAGWLGAASAVWVFVALFFWPLSTATTSVAISRLGARFAILTLLLFGLGFALRQYASSKHNETVNLHRQNALKTFETFVSAASEPEVKDAVLLESARSIFTPQTSGFLRGRQETESPSMLVEVIRRIGARNPDGS